MNKHTPGPWKMDSGQVVRVSDGAVIANMDRSEEASKAGIYPVERDDNARLIAAAPELLEACNSALVELAALVANPSTPDFMPALGNSNQADADCLAVAYSTLRTAIAKAEGR
jgi:hypothetical protein